jgi:hypothetical protein
MNFQKSRCKGIWLHRFELVADYNGWAVKERCARCGKEVVFKLDSNGNADNNRYLSYHARQALLKEHSLYSHEYPNAR